MLSLEVKLVLTRASLSGVKCKLFEWFDGLDTDKNVLLFLFFIIYVGGNFHVQLYSIY